MMEVSAALVATLHVCRSRIGDRSIQGPKFFQDATGAVFEGGIVDFETWAPTNFSRFRPFPAQKTHNLDHIHLYDTPKVHPPGL